MSKPIYSGDTHINPSHYRRGIETIDVLESKLTPIQYEGFLIGTIVKYITRFDTKNGLEDVKKAHWYIERLEKYLGKHPELDPHYVSHTQGVFIASTSPEEEEALAEAEALKKAGEHQ